MEQRNRKRWPVAMSIVVVAALAGMTAILIAARIQDGSRELATDAVESRVRWEDNRKVMEEVDSAGRKNGRFRMWIGSALVVEGRFNHDREEGLWKAWYEDGAPQLIGAYSDGKPVGLWCTWWESQQLKSAGTYDNGLEHGFWVTMDKDGTVIDSESGLFDRGNRMSEGTADHRETALAIGELMAIILRS